MFSVTITSSTTARSISGMATVMSVVPSDTPNAAKTFRLWRARNGQSRRIQLVVTRSACAAPVRPRRCAARRSSSACVERGERLGDARGSSTWASTSSSGRASRPLRPASCSRPSVVTVSVVTRRSSSYVGALDEAPFHQRVDGRRHRGLGQREAAGEVAGAVGAAGDHGEEPVLGEGQRGVELPARALEQPGQPGEGEEVGVSTPEVYRTVRDPTYVRNSSGEVRRRLRSTGKPAFTAA